MSLLVFLGDGWKVVWMEFLSSKRFWLQRRADMMKVTHLFENWRENNTSKQLSQFNFCFRPLFPCDKKGSQRYKCPSAPQWHLAKSAPTKVLCQIIEDFPVSLLWPHGNLRCTIFWGVLKFYVVLIKFTQLAWNKESQFALWILSRLLEFRNATDWCLKRCDQKCRKLSFFKCMVAICHHVQQSNMFFFNSVQLSPAVLHIGDNGTSDHTQSNAERKTNGVSHHADTSRKLPEVKLRNWYLFPERTPKSSWLKSMKSTKKTNWAATKRDPGMQFNLTNLYLAVWILEPSTRLEVCSLENKFHFGVPRIPSFSAVPVAFAKQDVCEIPNDPTKHPPNVTSAPNSHHRFVKWVTTLGTWTVLMILGCFPLHALASHLIRLDVLTSWVVWQLQPIQEKIRAAFNWVSSACRNSKVTSCLRFNTAFCANIFFESKNIPSPKSSKII